MPPTRYEKIMTRLQNHRVLAVVLLLGTIVMGVSAFTDATRNLGRLFSSGKPSLEDSRLKLASLGIPYTATEFVERAAAGDLTVVNLFLAAGMDPNVMTYEPDGPTALFLAARENRLPVVVFLLKAGAKVIHQASNAVVGAAQSGNPDLLNLVLKSPVERHHLDEAFAVSNSRQILEILLARGADVKTSGARALLNARDPAAVDFLKSRGADINAKDTNGRTLMERTDFTYVNIETLDILIQHGANLDSRDVNGWTLLQRYASKGYVTAMAKVLANGVTVDALNPQGRTALSLAAELKYDNGLAAVRLLLQKGADVNTKDGTGKTPLFYARQQAQPAIIQLLVEHGAKDLANP